MLSPLAAKKDLMYCSDFGTFSGTGGKGIFPGSSGGGRHFRHPQAAFFELVIGDVIEVAVLQMDGKLFGKTWRSLKAFSESKQPFVFWAKYIIWLVWWPLADIRTGNTPNNSRRVLVTPRIPWVVGSRLLTLHPNWFNKGTPG